MPYSEKQLRKNEAIMSRGEALAVELVTYEEKRAPGTMRLLCLSPSERAGRARRFLLTAIGLGLLAVVCPPHIPWPFVGLAVGLVGYFGRMKRAELLLGGQTHCPECNAFQILDPSIPEFPLLHFCTACGKRSTVETAAQRSPLSEART